MLLQGHLFLSARIIGFHADLFGHKTKFFFLWEDIDGIQVAPPTLSSMGSPIIVITLRPGRGSDARHGAKLEDNEGRLKYYFHTFVSFNMAHRTIMALWRARALTPEHKVQIIEEESKAHSIQYDEMKNIPAPDEELEAKVVDEESESRSLYTVDSASLLGVEDLTMSVIYSSVLPLLTSFFMELFRGSEIDQQVMERAGCVNYSHNP